MSNVKKKIIAAVLLLSIVLIFLFLNTDKKSNNDVIKKKQIKNEYNEVTNTYTIYDSENNIIKENIDPTMLVIYENDPNYDPELPEGSIDDSILKGEIEKGLEYTN